MIETTKGDIMNPRELREKKGFTTKYIAEQLGIKPTTLTKKERTNSFAAFNSLQIGKLCELYDVKVEELNI